ncbi:MULTISPECIES: CHAT domain-containing protein [Planktothricoides]|uniref:Tetratricopeptide repeat protein n=1 Tax=Planktothricoides raciborskii FACHB-1370 TaxID=2949576 RepID=A0ABR8EJ22_9CYAN|nr:MULTISPECIES: tetratricopeptide repeat protein [Planktothricoides]MBD2546653.1 tetratricopeptide repeat protein [Planktothricoides raciborskii FACHB-1370]MBD2585166.1 tetratricopeptide repeat protein [Planktothricoides raciborskii FACHB-1261]
MKRLLPAACCLLTVDFCLLQKPLFAIAKIQYYEEFTKFNLDKREERESINRQEQMGLYEYRNGRYSEALEIYQEVLKQRREIGDLTGEAATLHRIGGVYNKLANYEAALNFYQAALRIRESLQDRSGIGSSLNSIGGIYFQMGQYDTAIEVFQAAIAIREELGDRLGVSRTLNNIASLYQYQGKYGQAVKFYQQALEIFQFLEQPSEIAAVLNNIGLIHHHLGQYDLALEFYQKTLAMRQKINDRLGQGETLNNIGLVYYFKQEYQPALDFYQQALAWRREIGDRQGIGQTLNNLGLLYNDMGEYAQALELLNQALNIYQEIDNQASEARTLDSLGTTYKNLGDFQQARKYYFSALRIHQAISDRRSSRITLSNLGDLLLQENQIELAIIFYKQSVNITEEIRQDLQTLSLEQQRAYSETISNTYRTLADLLLQKGRIREAQRVLDLLKIQELDNYLHNVPGNAETAEGIELLPQEQDLFNFVQKDRRIVEQFTQFIQSPALINRISQVNRITQGESLDIQNFNSLQQRLGNVSKTAAILYPLVLSDRLELVLVIPDYPPIHRSVPVTQTELEQGIKNFLVSLTSPLQRRRINLANQSGKQLYDWLIKPIENDLALLKVDTIIYAPDGQLRYIPLAALYDGDRWLIERFRVNNITAASLTNFDPQVMGKIKMFAAAFTQGSYQFNLGGSQLNLSGLEFAGEEVANIAKIIPNTRSLFNHNFNLKATLPQELNQYNIVHLATHAAFIDGQPEESFILLGDGSRITLRDLETWSLPNVQLMVLSACQTAVGEFLGNGQEILGFGYQMQKAGVKAAIASLWSVDDRATQELMTEFYHQFSTGTVTKAEALRQAQLSLITNSNSEDNNPQHNPQFKHPYYWSSFILIGNGF